MMKIQTNGTDVKTISMTNSKSSKEIIPLKLILDADSEIRTTNFHGTTKTGRPYITPQLVFCRARGKVNSLDISFPLHQIQPIIDSLKTIKTENNDYFEDL